MTDPDAEMAAMGPFRPGTLLGTLVILALGTGLFVLRDDLTLRVRYRWAEVADIVVVPGGDMHQRAVLVDLGDRSRLLRTSDWQVRTERGGRVCVSERGMLLRRWTRYGLVLPGYCARQPVLPATGPGGPAEFAPLERFD